MGSTIVTREILPFWIANVITGNSRTRNIKTKKKMISTEMSVAVFDLIKKRELSFKDWVSKTLNKISGNSRFGIPFSNFLLGSAFFRNSLTDTNLLILWHTHYALTEGKFFTNDTVTFLFPAFEFPYYQAYEIYPCVCFIQSSHDSHLILRTSMLIFLFALGTFDFPSSTR